MSEQAVHVWANPEDPFVKVVAVGGHGITLANPSREQIPAVVAAYQGGDFAVVPGVTHVPWNALVKLTSNQKGVDVDFDYKSNGEEKSKNFDFPSQADRDAFFQLVRTQYGQGLRYEVKDPGPLGAALAPALWLAGIAVLTFILYKAAQQIAAGEQVEARGRRRALKALFAWLLDLIGPTGVAVIGLILIALCVFVLVRRVTDPPVWMILKRG